MKKIFLITEKFPYMGGEQFIEAEVKYYENIELTIIPKIKSINKRNIPRNVTTDDVLVNNYYTKNKAIYFLKSLKSKVFYKELFSELFLNLKKLRIFFSSICAYQMYYDIFDNYFSKVSNPKDIIIYTYWNDEATYALQDLKDKYQYMLISRVHGWDLYKERRAFNYMPLKKHFINNIDVLFTITPSANEYLQRTFNFKKNTLKLSRLGVNDKKIITKSSKISSLNIVSCSFLSEVKQVDKIIKSLKIIASQMNNIHFSWIHIGDGALYETLVLLAKNELSGLKNIEYSFVGRYENAKVYEFYSNNRVDVFLNTSLSEGVPVSIMEAMSCHIPIIAPDIGGIKDMLIHYHNGLLLSRECPIAEIVASLKNINFFKKSEIRENSYKLFLEKYNAKINYIEFIKIINLFKKTDN